MQKADHLLIRAAFGEPVERPPVWAMRQAGRWDPEFNRLRGSLSFYEFSENVELAAQASLLPRRFGVDAIILFYDITTLAVAMGLPFALHPGRGPVPDAAIATLADVRRLDPDPDPERFGHVRKILRLVKDQVQGSLPVIVFAGAPFTLASYCIGAGKDLNTVRRFAAEKIDVWQSLLEQLEQATICFLQSLVREGADLYQLFDSWAGLLERDEYLRWSHARHQRIFAAAAGVPRILFVKECPYLELMVKSGAEVVSLGTTHNLAAAKRQYPGTAFQGNVSEELLRTGSPEQVFDATRRCIKEGGGRNHIVNLSHGVDRGATVANFEAFVRAVRG
jgi:uroporphyrinogen decarboxylase